MHNYAIRIICTVPRPAVVRRAKRPPRRRWAVSEAVRRSLLQDGHPGSGQARARAEGYESNERSPAASARLARWLLFLEELAVLWERVSRRLRGLGRPRRTGSARSSAVGQRNARRAGCSPRSRREQSHGQSGVDVEAGAEAIEAVVVEAIEAVVAEAIEAVVAAVGVGVVRRRWTRAAAT